MLADAERTTPTRSQCCCATKVFASDELRASRWSLVLGAELIRKEYEEDGYRGVTGSRIKNEVPVPLVPWDFAAETLGPWRSRMAPIVELADWDLPAAPAGCRRPTFSINPSRAMRALSVCLTTAAGRACAACTRTRSRCSSPPSSRASAIVAIADWDLLFSNNALAVDGYTLARGMLEQAGANRASITQIFAPELPVVLPAFERNPLAPDATPLPRLPRRDVRDHEVWPGPRHRDSRCSQVGREGGGDLAALLKSSRFRPRLRRRPVHRDAGWRCAITFTTEDDWSGSADCPDPPAPLRTILACGNCAWFPSRT